ncbi:MAG: hypothetical protein KDA44_07255 [Planctomycetales bacterium]|nr:hypothetical protein [Planctomycetales bacterium]
MQYLLSGRTLILLAIAAVVFPVRSSGVPINFNTSVEFIDSSSIDLSLGELIYAINAGGTAVPNETVTVGATPVIFQSLGNAVNVGKLATDFPNMNNAATPGDLYATATDQLSLDRILDGQAWNDDAAATVTLQNLTVGQFYRIQVIGAADTRDCCGGRIHDVHSPDGGTTGYIDRNQDYDLDTVSHVITAIGDFTADSTSQQLVFDGVNNAAFSGLILTSSSPSAIPHPQITINRDTGSVILENTNSQAASSLLGYSLTSAAGSFDQGQWTQISTAYDESGNKTVDPNDDWTVVTSDPSVTTDLSEFNFDTPGDAAVFSPLQKINLGTPWIQTPFEDVIAEITLADSTTQSVDVVFTGTPIAIGDLSGDGAINGSDWTQFKNGFSSPLGATTLVEAYLKGDLDGDMDQDLNDFTIFEQAYDAANGAGALAALVASVPEPSCLFLAVLALGGGGLVRSRRWWSCVVRCSVLLVAIVSLSSQQAWAVAFNFDAPTEFVDSNNIDLSLGEVVYAINAGGPAMDRTVNVGGTSVFFEAMEDSTRITHNVAGPLAGFNGGPAGLYPVPTDQTALDDVLNTHAWNDEAPVVVTLQGLQVGASYRLQVLGPADTRECCTGRDQFVASVDGGAPGEIHRYRDLDLDTVSHVLTASADFTADSTTQGISFYGPSDVLAGLAGFVLTSSSPHGLSLTVDRETGNLSLSNQTPNAISFDSYQITSAGASLLPAAWSSISERGAPLSGFPQGDGMGNGWEQATNPTDGGMAEWYLNPNDALPYSSLVPGGSIDLGNAYSTSIDARDLQFSYRQTDGTVVPRPVTYIGEPAGLPGDFNNDDRVDGADFLAWQRNPTLGSLSDWQGHFGQSLSVGAAAAVPEPGALALSIFVLMLGGTGFSATRRR